MAEALPVAARERLVEVVEVGAAVLVGLEAAERGPVGDDPLREPGEHGARGEGAVEAQIGRAHV